MSEMKNPEELFEKITRLQWLLQRLRLKNRGAHGPSSDPTRGQGRVLALLKLQPEISTKALSYLLDIRQQSLSELLGKLERAGYITRSPLESDRRVMTVKLTDKGKAAHQESPDFSNLSDCLTPEEQALLSDFLDRITRKVETALSIDCSPEAEQWMERNRSHMSGEAFEQLTAMRGRGSSCGNQRQSGGRGECDLHRRLHDGPDDPRR